MFREAFCPFCSIEKEDIREFEKKGRYSLCGNCGGILIQVPESKGSPYGFDLTKEEFEEWKKMNL